MAISMDSSRLEFVGESRPNSSISSRVIPIYAWRVRIGYFSQAFLRVFPRLKREGYLNYNSYRSAPHPRRRLL